MEAKVTFKSLKRGRYRCNQTGEITKNPKKTRFIIIRAHGNQKIQVLREKEARKKEEERELLSELRTMQKFRL